jgi:hypothetical protein
MSFTWIMSNVKTSSLATDSANVRVKRTKQQRDKYIFFISVALVDGNSDCMVDAHLDMSYQPKTQS